MNIGAKVLRFERCATTNDLARNLAARGEDEGMVIIAAEQAMGRGTRGRSWFSPKGKGLYLSVVFRPPADILVLLPLAAGLAVREALATACGLEAGLKWPNDVFACDKKVGGILCESQWTGSRLDFVVVGIGLNLYHTPQDFTFHLRHHAASVQMLTGKSPEEALVLEHLFARMDFWYGMLRRGKKADILTEYEKRMIIPASRKITVIHSQGRTTGQFRGLEPDASLRLKTEDGMQTFKAADIMDVIYEKK